VVTSKPKHTRNRKTGAAARAIEVEFADAFETFVGEVMLLNGRLMSIAAEIGEDIEVTPTQWQAVVVAMGRPRTVSQYARRLGVQRQTMQYTISGLVRRGLMELAHNPDHRRSPIICLTSEGKDLFTELHRRRVELCRRFTDGLDLTVADMIHLSKGLRVLRLHAIGRDERE